MVKSPELEEPSQRDSLLRLENSSDPEADPSATLTLLPAARDHMTLKPLSWMTWLS
jgi:hypothetical protein